ncbi:MAG: hypothetical protein PHW96_03125, partial [Candidatus Nanoarchaeia archaeon]|nr:hypothetical protein [Candidatus Nanoarchaeia archaeon]
SAFAGRGSRQERNTNPSTTYGIAPIWIASAGRMAEGSVAAVLTAVAVVGLIGLALKGQAQVAKVSAGSRGVFNFGNLFSNRTGESRSAFRRDALTGAQGFGSLPYNRPGTANASAGTQTANATANVINIGRQIGLGNAGNQARTQELSATIALEPQRHSFGNVRRGVFVPEI